MSDPLTAESVPAALLAWLREQADALCALVEELAQAESPSLVPEAQAGVYAILERELVALGHRVRAVPGVRTGDHLVAWPAVRRKDAPYQLVAGHMDTVWPLGTLETMPVYRDGDRLYGPGVVDMKAGLAQAVFALRALAEAGLEPEATPVVLVTADEEIGSVESLPLLRRLGRGASRALILEAAYGMDGRLKTARKGTGWFRISARGRAAHAGVAPEQGLSAIVELSHQIQRLHALNDHERGITVNVGTIDGGLRPNVVAPEASAVVDVRVPTTQAGEQVERAIRGLEPVTDGVTLEVEGRLARPPMERTPRNAALWRTAHRLGSQLGLSLEETAVGGASDGNYTSLLTATLDGLGPVGRGAHAHDEQVVISALPERAALLALLLLAPPGGDA